MSLTKEAKLVVAGIAGVAVLAGGIIGGFVAFEKIDNGYVGVRYSMSGGVRDETLQQGVKFVGLDKVTQYPIRLQTTKVKKLNLATKDGKATHVSITYSYKVDPAKVSSVFKEFGSIKVEDIEGGWLKSQLLKSGRNVMADYSILEVVGGKSTEVQSEILANFQQAVEKKGFLVEDLSFGVPDLDTETKASIDKIQLASQDNERAKLEAEKLQTETKSKAEAQITQAQADAESTLKRAEAEAEANRLKSESITDKILREKEADARLKHGWVTIQGGTAVVDATK